MRALLIQRWNGTTIYVHGEAIDAMMLPAMVAGEREGLATYRVKNAEAELVSLDAVEPGRGIGARLLAALAFYEKRGFRLRRIRAGAVDETRRLKPGIPLISETGIPIRDEIDLSCDL
ncbi:MAG TPA: hypothetical protein VJ822_00780 [Dongiaceae bacterium]|nr:hypothetical protein [Dongiaceae bacterium]